MSEPAPALLHSVVSGLLRIARFSGRDNRFRFWPYGGLVFALMLTAVSFVMTPVMEDSIMRMQQFAIDNPDLATITRSPTSYEIRIEGNHPELVPDFSRMWPGMAATVAVTMVLLGAAATRRLHDVGWSGFVALAPVLLLGASMAITPRAMAAPETGIDLFFAGFLVNMAYVGSLVGLIVLLALPGKAGPNRYGPPPAPIPE